MLESIIQGVVNFSKVDIQHVRIAGATADSFLFSLDAQVYRTGPFYASLSAMTIDLVGPGGRYAQLALPQVSITPKETRIKIEDQRINILDMEAFMTFTEVLVRGGKGTLSLENGQATVKVMGMTFPIKFNKKCEMMGMNGPRTEFVTADGTGDVVFAKIWNPSPLEMDLGSAIFECRNKEGRALARFKGRIVISHGASKHEMKMNITAAEEMMSAGDVSQLWVIGVGVESKEETWLNQGIRSYNVEMPVTEDLLKLIRKK